MTGLIVGLMAGIAIGMVVGWFAMARGRAAAARADQAVVEPPEQRAARRHLEQELEREPEPGPGEGNG